jgi:hypothetical protein
MATGNELFAALREILRGHASVLSISDDSSDRFCLEGAIGPATLVAWGGKRKRELIPVAWVALGKSSVRYHLIGLDGNAALLAGLSPALRARLRVKTLLRFGQL